MLTRFGNPVGTMMTFRPLASVVSVARNGNTSLGAADCAETTAVNAAAERIVDMHRCIVALFNYSITQLLNYPIPQLPDYEIARSLVW